MRVNKNLAVICCVMIVFFSFFTSGQFVIFLSSHTCLNCVYNRTLYKNTVENDSVLAAIIWNVTLLAIFILQHSLQANIKVKNFLHNNGLDVFERLLYNCGSCISLQIVMNFWQPIPSMTIWEVSTSDHTIWWWLFTTIHFISWLITYSGCFIMDITELLGVKQVYHDISHWAPPFCQKSEGLLRFYLHMRHPSFSALTMVLFIHPVMQIDRMLIAYAFTIYMIARFKVDDVDYFYQRRMLQRKYRDLYLNS